MEEVIAGYWACAEMYYRMGGESTEERNHIRRAARVLRRLYGTWLAAEFSPLKLKGHPTRGRERGRRNLIGLSLA